MHTCSLCSHWISTQGLFAFCSLQDELKKFRDGCTSWQAASESRAVCEYCGRPERSPNYAYHLCISYVEKATWMRSGAQGRILHLVNSSGLAQCGKQFDPQKTEQPKASSNALTMPYCQTCAQVEMKGDQNA